MKNQFQITVSRVDNGFTIRASSDERILNPNLVAKNEQEIQEIIPTIVKSMFAEAPEPKKISAPNP